MDHLHLPQHRILDYDHQDGAMWPPFPDEIPPAYQTYAYNEITGDGDTKEAKEDDTNLRNLLIQIFSNVLLFLLIFGMSATVDFRRIKQQLRNCYAISAGVTMQFIIMPALGFIAVFALKKHGLTAPMGITLLLVTSSPGGSYSNWWCSLFNADLALSVAMTALSTLISLAALPANLVLYSHLAYGLDADQERNVLASVDFKKLLVSLAIVISAIVLGLFASYKFENVTFRRAANAGGTFAGIALIIISGVFSTTGGSEVKPWNQPWSFYVGVALPCVVGLCLSNIIAKFAKLTKPEVVTLSVECSYQNTGIATSAVLAMFDDPESVAQAMAVPLFYGVVEMVVLGLYCLAAWKMGWTKAPSEEKICTVISKTYEIECANGDNIDDATALQDSVDPDAKNSGRNVEEGRDRVDTMLSEDTCASVSDISAGADFGSSTKSGRGFTTVFFGGGKGNEDDHPSSIRVEQGTKNGNGKRALQHVRSLPPQLDPNAIPVEKVFHTIQEDSECVVEVAEHRVRDRPTSTTRGSDYDDEEGRDATILAFMSFKGKDYEHDGISTPNTPDLL